ncbi:Gfo/Idh/MocA family oxidoreductase, partial [Chloroflexota bacterium]
EVNWLTPTKIREVLVLGERGMFRVDDLTQELYFFENSQTQHEKWYLQNIFGVSEGSMIRYPLQRYEPLKAEIEAFIMAVQGGQINPVTGEDGVEALRLALALLEAGLTNKVIYL